MRQSIPISFSQLLLHYATGVVRHAVNGLGSRTGFINLILSIIFYLSQTNLILN
jgi:uncharacterized membrane protein